MVSQADELQDTASAHRRWPDIAAGASAALAVFAIAVVLGESLLERTIAECFTSRVLTIDRMITTTVALSTLAVLAGLAALIGRSGRWWLAAFAIGVAALAGWIAFGGYQCFTVTG